MRRKRKKRHFIINILFMMIVFMTVVSLGYSYLSLVLKIGGKVTGKMTEQNFTIMSGSDPNLNISITKSNTWQEGNLYKYQYSFHITNVGQATIDNFKITANFLNNIDSVSIWNYDYTISGKTLTIINNIYILASQQSINVDFVLTSRYSNQIVKTVKLESFKNTNEVTLNQFNVGFSITNVLGQYTYQYDVVLTNKTGSRINTWQVSIVLPEGTTYVNGWNAIYSYSGNVITIKNETYNGKLNNNASTTIGLQLSTNIINFIPSNIRVTVR